MKIGIDVDGVLTNVEQFQLDYGSKFYFESKKNKSINVDNDEYDILDIFNWGIKMNKKFWKKYLFHYAKKYPPREFASEIIEKLKSEGNEIYIITARFLSTENSIKGSKMRRTLKKWLKNNKIYYDKIIFCKESKVEVCLENKIDIMIEDSPNNIKELSKYLKMIAYDCEYNEDLKGKNIYRCYSWYEIYETINSLKN